MHTGPQTLLYSCALLRGDDSCSWRTSSRSHHSCTLASPLLSSGCQLHASRSPCRYMTASASGPSSACAPVAARARLGAGTSSRGMRARTSTGGEGGASAAGGRSECRIGARMKVARRGSGVERKGSETPCEKDWSCERGGGGGQPVRKRREPPPRESRDAPADRTGCARRARPCRRAPPSPRSSVPRSRARGESCRRTSPTGCARPGPSWRAAQSP